MATNGVPRICGSSFALLLVLTAGAAAAGLPKPVDSSLEASPVPIVPLPKKVTLRSGTFTFAPATKIQAPAALRGIAERFRNDLYPATGLPLPVVARAAGSRVVLALEPGPAPGVGGSKLTISPP